MKSVRFVATRTLFVGLLAWLICAAFAQGIPNWTTFLATWALLWTAWVLEVLRRRWSYELAK